MSIQRLSSGSVFEARIGYARAVHDGDYVHISGTTGYNYASMQIETGVEAQAERAMLNIEAALAQAGLNCSHIVRVRYIFPDRQDFEPCWPIFQRFLGAHPPAATMMVAQLLEPAMKLEIEATAKAI